MTDPDQVKKPYSTPRLQLYGDIREITKAVGGVSQTADGGQVRGTNKTR